MDNLKPELVSMDEAKNDPNAIVMQMDKDAIPNLEVLTNEIFDFLVFIDEPQIIELRNSQNGNFLKLVEEKFKNIPLSITKMLTDETEDRVKNITKLLEMFQTLNKVKKGESNIDSEFENFKEGLSEEYIYPKFGGKEEFERKMSEKK